MKKLILIALLSGFAAGAYAQGFIFLDNINNTNYSPTATSSGLFFGDNGVGPVLMNGDFNAAFYGGTDSANLQLIASFSGASAAGSGGFGAGYWLDPTGKSYPVAGTTTASTSAFFMVQFWMGSATSYYAASGIKGQSFVFSNPVAAPPNTPPDLTGMPAVVCACPEPSTFVLISLAGFTLLLALRGKGHRKLHHVRSDVGF